MRPDALNREGTDTLSAAVPSETVGKLWVAQVLTCVKWVKSKQPAAAGRATEVEGQSKYCWEQCT
jgi:hypothetical protein